MNIIKLVILFIVLPVCLSCSHNKTNNKFSSKKLEFDSIDDTYSVMSGDASMNLAMNEAKETISKFDQALKSNNHSYTKFAIKKRYNTDDGGGEYLWIAGISFVNGNYKGFVNNDGEKTIEVKYGDTVIVRKDEITDWMYLENNLLRGGYTIREIRNRMNKEDQVKMDKELGFKIEK